VRHEVKNFFAKKKGEPRLEVQKRVKGGEMEQRNGKRRFEGWDTIPVRGVQGDDEGREIKVK